MSGARPLGAYQSSQTVDVKFFSEQEGMKREEEIRNGMPFMHDLIQAKLKYSYDSRRRRNPVPNQKRKKTYIQTIPEDDSDNEESPNHVGPTGDENEIEAEEVEGVTYVPENDPRKADAHRLRMVSINSSTVICDCGLLTFEWTLNRSRSRCALRLRSRAIAESTEIS